MHGSTGTGAAEPVDPAMGGGFGGVQVPGDRRSGRREVDEADREPDLVEPHQGGGAPEVDSEPLVDVHVDLAAGRVGQSGGADETLRASSLGGDMHRRQSPPAGVPFGPISCSIRGLS